MTGGDEFWWRFAPATDVLTDRPVPPRPWVCPVCPQVDRWCVLMGHEQETRR